MTGIPDHELRARFDELRAADEQGAPGFGAVLARARFAAPDRTQRRRRRRLGVALSIAAAIVLAVGISRTSRRRSFVAQPLSTWRSPTASLLRTPGLELLASPSLIPSALDHLTTTLAQREGK
jgi:hypothetical protein